MRCNKLRAQRYAVGLKQNKKPGGLKISAFTAK